MERILFVGIDVDDKAFHGYGIFSDTNERVEFSCRPNVGSLQSKLALHCISGAKPKICYEATYLGFSLYRRIKSVGIDCDVIAPSLIPSSPADKVKTDKLDCKSLAEYYRANLLTRVHVPDEKQEIQRDIVRSRQFLKDQVKGLKLHILSLCRRMDLNYRQETENKNYWTQEHQRWIEKKVRESENADLRFNLVTLLNQLKYLQGQLQSYREEIERLSQAPLYRDKVRALCAYRGISTLTAMTLIVETGDIRRFAHPRQYTSYAGFDIREYSSGGRRNQFSITKMGNRHIRTAAVEAVQKVYLKPHISKRLRQQRAGAPAATIDIADRCMNRLYTKSRRLLGTGKNRNKVKVACARELLCFVWESLTRISEKELGLRPGDVASR